MITLQGNDHVDTQNDGLEKETPFKYGNFWNLSQISDCFSGDLQ